MYAYQGDHEDSIVEEFKSAKIVLDGSEAGSGKSRMSATVCKKMGYRGFVLCSKTALSFWVEELKAIGIKFDVVNYETFKGGHIFKSNGSHTTSFERVKFTTFEPNTLVIFDEIHVCKNDTQRREMLQDILNHPIKLLGLSATVPKVNDFLPPCKVFKVGFKSSFTNTVNWTNRFTEAKQPKFNFRDVQNLELKKVPLYLKSIDASKTERNVVFCAYNETIRRLQLTLTSRGVPFITINGLNSNETNMSNITRFQRGEVDTLFVNIQTGGASLNLQDKIGRPITSHVNIVWSEILFIQMLRRIYRVNSMSDCEQNVLVTDDPLDKYMCSILLQKIEGLM